MADKTGRWLTRLRLVALRGTVFAASNRGGPCLLSCIFPIHDHERVVERHECTGALASSLQGVRPVSASGFSPVIRNRPPRPRDACLLRVDILGSARVFTCVGKSFPAFTFAATFIWHSPLKRFMACFAFFVSSSSSSSGPALVVNFFPSYSCNFGLECMWDPATSELDPAAEALD